MARLAISGILVQVPDHPGVLIVDAAEASARGLTRDLEHAGFAVTVAGSGPLVEATLAETVPDLVILDGVADPDCFELCRRLKSDERTQQVPVIGVSDDASDGARIEAIRAGFDHWFSKPAPLLELVERARVLIRQAAVHRANTSKTQTLMMWHDWVRYFVHDLRSPIAVAIADVRFALDDLPTTYPEIRENLDEALGQMRRLTEMLQEVLDTNRLERGALSPQRAEADLAELARTVADGARRILGSKTPVTVEELGDGIAQIDASLIQRVLTNLVGNSARYARAGGVRIEIHGTLTDVRVRIVNDGPAIAKEIQARLFEPWSKLKPGAGGQGTGLGLAFCRSVIDAHEGRIWLDSGEEGDVAFAFELPRAVQE